MNLCLLFLGGLYTAKLEAEAYALLVQMDNEWVLEMPKSRKKHCNYICSFPQRSKIIVITVSQHTQPLVSCLLVSPITISFLK